MKSLQGCAHENHELILKYLLYSFNSTDINSHPFRQGKEGNSGENESLEVHKNKFYKIYFFIFNVLPIKTRYLLMDSYMQTSKAA